ncbi:hypothetical protein [Lysinibacillus irui]|uniref:Uncharacterized protein n=1 Tax=Lysinibacillus irui TaxID=2998077 RepID=A0AAJ5S036_9BACI|nr:hypothetical protein [Lysinibacillus irui]WDV09289.1 hypothetical protein OU989_22460 [Lysinibacillus irui]
MKENESGFVGVMLLYGALLVLIAYLLKISSNKEWENTSFWFTIAGAVALVQALKYFCGRLNNSNVLIITMILAEMVTISICTMIGLMIATYLVELKIVTSFATVLLIGFAIIYIIYELFAILGRYIPYNKKYRQLRKEFEEKYNMVNILTILATVLTFLIFAKGAEASSAKDTLMQFFFSCCIVYVLLIHYCWKFKLNK